MSDDITAQDAQLEVNEAVRADGWLRAERPADPATEEAVEEDDGGSNDELAYWADQQAETLDAFGLAAPPEGWVEEPETPEDFAFNNKIISDLLGVGKPTEQERQTLLDEAIARYQGGEAPKPLADLLARVDPEVADDFARHWREDERSQDYVSGEDWIKGRREMDRMLAEAQRIVEENKQAEQEEAARDAAFWEGVSDFEAGLSPSDRQYKERAKQIAAETLGVALAQGLVGPDQLAAKETHATALRTGIDAARHEQAAKAEAQFSADWDENDPDIRGGFMDNPQAPKPDRRKTFEEHYAESMDQRSEEVRAAATRQERVAAASDISDEREKLVASGWNIGPPAPSSKPSEESPEEEDDLFDTDLERTQREGWNLSTGGPRRGHNMWNPESRRKRR